MKPATKKAIQTAAEYLHERGVGELDKTTAAPEHEILVTPIGYSIHCAGDNPVFGNTVTHVTIDDDASGPYLVLQQYLDDTEMKPGRVQIPLDELERVLEAARRLMETWPEKPQ